jgi:hypothetical protein
VPCEKEGVSGGVPNRYCRIELTRSSEAHMHLLAAVFVPFDHRHSQSGPWWFGTQLCGLDSRCCRRGTYTQKTTSSIPVQRTGRR